ncbi:hypothetical protein CALVIDRAFT_474406 [Calocera viscosa TUFC12733]|uniref:Programmed cell death protein 2 C-terminal domain-containing protein n=1 Tax=Calocera viscosa (strain TUFC12733) TaxID=1330018 RepID=A0A167SGM9_CALVF|nr:hypothetical protein CALVIDRAFT_474406 [Calocera viscosa TUFC12733]
MSSEDDWSDSDSEFESEQQGEVYTSVFLGIPDGPLTSAYDDADAAVSRAGGLPPFLPLSQYPSPDVCLCKRCNQPMELLVSVFCPFEGSLNDRVLYVWACAKAECQRKEGSVRAYRSLCHNAKYARKLERQKEHEAARALAPKVSPSQAASATNPFSAPPTGGLGDLLLGSTGTAIAGTSNNGQPAIAGWDEASGSDDGSDDEEDEEENDGDEEEAEPAQGASVDASRRSQPNWSSQPSYRPLYISTIDEYITPKPPPPVPKKVINEAQSSTDAGGSPWGKETYEVMHKVDEIFERFVARVQEAAQQVVRYDLSGTPLPFSSRDPVYQRIFPVQAIAPGTAVSVNGPPEPIRHAYDPSAVDACPRCGGPRVFECQLMPNLISILKRPDSSPSKTKKPSAEERQQELSALLKGGTDGMEWGTIMVFSCLADCCQDATGAPATETWVEEMVLVQWDV